MTAYRTVSPYRNPAIYRRGLAAGVGYRAGIPYRNPYAYRPSETVLGAAPPGVRYGDGFAWRRANAHAALAAVPLRDVSAHDDAAALAWSGGRPFDALSAWRLRQQTPCAGTSALLWALSQHQLARQSTARYLHGTPYASSARMPWGEFANAEQAAVRARYLHPAAHAVSTTIAWGELAAHARAKTAVWRALLARGAVLAMPWSAMRARTGETIVIWPPTPPIDPGTILVPDLPVYVMLPTMTAVRLPDRTPLPLLSISVTAEAGAFDWSFSAPLPMAALALVNPDDGTQHEIEVVINGFPWTFIVEAYDDNRRFGSRTYTLRGRSRSAQLATPFAAGRTYTEEQERTAAQLAAQELPPGWSLVWDTVDWLVPGGTWSYQDLTPLEAVTQLAASVGAVVRSDPQAREIRVEPQYRHSPWHWSAAAPYAVLPAAAIGDGSSSWRGGTNAEAVYVYAQNAPTGALVRLAGTSGAVQLPMIVDPLVVHADAQRERGRQEIAASGRAREVLRTIPLFPTPAPPGMPDLGLVPVGALLEFEEIDGTWRGQVSGVRIDAQRNGDAFTVRQHLTLERQYR